MILIADSGSTKSDWVVLDDSILVEQFTTIGFNPFFDDADFIGKTILSNHGVDKIADSIKAIFYYGAGCSDPEKNEIVVDGLSIAFPNASIKVNHDLAASAYAGYSGKPVIACILGTGSNACYFDGDTIHQEVPSLAYILGDEGSGCYFGKKVIQGYFHKKMPDHLRRNFKEIYGLTKTELLEQTYRQPNPNTYLASFVKFIASHQDENYFQEMLVEGFKTFLAIYVCCYKNHQHIPINFTGSIAYYFKEELKIAMAESKLKLGQIIQKPIMGLVEYHR